MISRYSHPLVTELWSPEWTYNAWLRIELETLRHQRHLRVFAYPGTGELLAWLDQVQVNEHAVDAIALIERKTKHDVAAFLEWLRAGAPGGQYIHFGLTSSDLVDTAQGMRFNRMHRHLLGALGELNDALQVWANNRTPVAGRTHGQPAEPTSIRARALHWHRTLAPAMTAVSRSIANTKVCKLSGPVGTFAHNPPELEQRVARALDLIPAGFGMSQIVPRTQLALWASSVSALVAACSKIAMDMRLMNLMGEVRWTQTDGQVGSSSMAHKNNPIIAEQIQGMSRLASGYAQMLQPLDGWLERDISQSSVERVAVPDLWHVLMHTIEQTTRMLLTAELVQVFIDKNLEENANALWVHNTTLTAIAEGETLADAREYALDFDIESYSISQDAAWFTRRLEDGYRE